MTARLASLQARLLAFRAVRVGRDVLAVLDRAGGGLLTAGLAYRILVTLLPGLALVVGAIGIFIGDATRREDIALQLIDAFPVLEPIVRDALLALAKGGTTLSIIALAGLAWASSALYVALDDALARILVGAPRLHFVRRRLTGVLVVSGLIAIVVVLVVGGTFAMTIVRTLAGGRTAHVVGADVAAIGPLAVVGAPVGLALLVYATMPRRRVRRRTVVAAGIVAGGLIGVATVAFQVLAPLVTTGPLALFGSFITVFAVLVWLGWVAQILLLGAAWMQVVSRGRPSSRRGAHGPAGGPDTGRAGAA